MQPFSPVNVLNEIMENTGCFENGRELTTMLLVDDDSSSLMFKSDEISICNHIDSIADQTINFKSNSLTRPYLPQLGFEVEKSPMSNHFQPPYLKNHIGESFRQILSQIDKSQKEYFAK